MATATALTEQQKKQKQRQQILELTQKGFTPEFIKFAYYAQGEDVSKVDTELSQLQELTGNNPNQVTVGGQNFDVKTLTDRKAYQEMNQAEIQSKKVQETAKTDLQTKLQALNDLTKDNSGLTAAVGPNPLARPYTPLSGDKQRFTGAVENILSTDTLDTLINAKAQGATFGALSEGELNLLKASASKIGKWAVRDGEGNVVGYNVSEGDFMKELENLKQQTAKALQSIDTTSTPQPTQTGGQQSFQQVKLNGQLVSVNEAVDWASKNPNDPKSQKILGQFGQSSMPSQETITISRANAVKGLVDQGITDPNEIKKIFDEQNQAQGLGASDFTIDEIKKYSSVSPEQAQQQGSSFDLGKAADKVANFLGIKKFGQGMGATIFLNTTEGKDLQKKAAEGDKVALEALKAVLDEAPTAKEVIGSAALTALNVATAGTLSGAGATSNVGKLATGAATGYGYDVTGSLEQNKSVGDALTPGLGTVAGFTGSALGIIANSLGKGGGKVAERIYNSTVKPTVEDTKKAILYQGKTLGREALDRGLVGGKEKLFHQSSSAIIENEKKLQNILKNSTETISREEIIPYLDKLKSKLSNTPTQSAKNTLQSIDESVKLLPETFTLSQANVFKRNIYEQVGDLAYKLDPNLKGEAQNSKAIASALKDLIEKKASSPEIGAINKELAVQGKIKDATLNGLAKTMGNNIAGVGTIGALIEKSIGSTPFKTYSAKVIDIASKKLEKLSSGNMTKITKVMVMNALREAQDEYKN